MFDKKLLFLLFYPFLLFAEIDYRVENTNFTIYGDSTLYNYDRLRFRGDYMEGEYFASLIADGVNFYGNKYTDSSEFEFFESIKSDTPFTTASEFYDYGGGSAYAKLYRVYVGYEDEKNVLVGGLINFSMGVGRIWTPSNVFNPKNSYALEPDEVFGIAGVSYTRYFGDTSHISAVISQKANHSFKYALQYKTMINDIEVGLNLTSSNELKMLGYEIESNLYDTGVEVRTEGAYIKQENHSGLFQGILGADYGFVNGVTLIAELLYSSQTFSYQERVLYKDLEIAQNLVGSNLYSALSLSYSFNLYLDGSLLYIESFDKDNSRFISPSLTYTFNDYHTFSLGAMLQNGPSESEFGALEDHYYLKWNMAFLRIRV